ARASGAGAARSRRTSARSRRYRQGRASGCTRAPASWRRRPPGGSGRPCPWSPCDTSWKECLYLTIIPISFVGDGRGASRVEASVLVRAETIWDLVERRAQLSPNEVALLDEGDTRLTFREFRDRAARVAAALHADGIGPGSRVAWQLFTKIDTYVLMVALARLGVVQAPIIPLYREREVAAAVTAAGADTLVVPGTGRGTDYATMASSLDLGGRAAPRVLVLENHGPPPESEDVRALPPPPADPDEPRWVYFTSGSTGLPKGVMHSDHSLLEAAYGFALHGGLGARHGDVGSVPFPVAHIGGVQYLISMLA